MGDSSGHTAVMTYTDDTGISRWWGWQGWGCNPVNGKRGLRVRNWHTN